MLAVDTDAFVRTYNSRAYIFIYGKVLYAFTPENDDVFLDYAHRIYPVSYTHLTLPTKLEV